MHPSAEAIELTVQPEHDTFSGKVDIDVQLDQPRQSVWLHARGLHVTSASLTPNGSSAIVATWADEDALGLGRLALTTADEARIDACTDLDTLRRWLDRAVVAAGVAEALK